MVSALVRGEPYLVQFADPNTPEYQALKEKVESSCVKQIKIDFGDIGQECILVRVSESSVQLSVALVRVRVSGTDVVLNITLSPALVNTTDLPSNTELSQALDNGTSTFGNIVVNSRPTATTGAPMTTTTTGLVSSTTIAPASSNTTTNTSTTASSGATLKISVNTLFVMVLAWLLSHSLQILA